MAYVQVEENDVPVAGKAIVARDFVYVDWDQVDQDLQNAFAFLSSIRVERVQLWATQQVKLENGAITANSSLGPLLGFGPIRGQITGLEPIDADGNVVGWPVAHALTFTIVATATITVPKTAISAAALAANPLLGLVIGGLLASLGSSVEVNIGHTTMNVPIMRDGNGRVIEIGTAKRP